MTKIIEVIETHERKGTGKEGDPFRLIYQLWSKDGDLIHEEFDKFKNNNK